MAEEEDSVEETNSGVKKNGNWKEIAEFGEEVEGILEESGSDSESIEKFGDWRPKVEESESDVKRKTVDEAVLKEREIERDSEGVKKDLKQASDKMAEAGKKAVKKEVPEKEIIEASSEAAKPLFSRIAGLLRKIESVIYSWITLRFNPYYLDTEDFSVDITDKRDGEFEMDVAVLEEEKREGLKEKFRDDE
ncbi:DUF5828 family protein [Candidatus Nanohalovita haloferacivicina]|uniref:DUF5828 family protein n=1 Tax=Candidatus Nanohalovita haloferacivicina TaxID=2978046 RepID=UPI00325FA3B4|nr:Uncharacterized protein HBNXNv_0145 [Candidatus Nanohalobia archaeon BNXNv]